jgi:hypothetical protein
MMTVGVCSTDDLQSTFGTESRDRITQAQRLQIAPILVFLSLDKVEIESVPLVGDSNNTEGAYEYY